jgi:hypothetical protein
MPDYSKGQQNIIETPVRNFLKVFQHPAKRFSMPATEVGSEDAVTANSKN